MTAKTMSPMIAKRFAAAANSRRPLVDNMLVESEGFTQMQVLEEESKNTGSLVVEGKIGDCNRPTKNKRFYSRGIMEREITRLQPRIKQRSLLAAVDHPTDGKSRIREAGAICVGLRMEDDGTIWGRYEIVEDSTGGHDLAAFLRRGAACGMSSRGLGSTTVNMEGHHVVGEDFRLHGFDFVADPACEDAYPSLVSEDVSGEQVTEDSLRANFAPLVEQIEDRARQTGAEIAEEDVRERVEEEFKQALDEAGEKLREDIKLQVESEVRESLRADFATKLVKALQEQRADIEAVVRSELLSDPSVAGAKRFVEDLAQKLVPYQPAPDQQVVMDGYEEKLAELREGVEESRSALQEKEEAMHALQERVTEAEKKAREFGFKLFLERRISGHPHAKSIREMVGDPTEFNTAEELRDHVESVIEQVDGAYETAEEQAQQRLKLKEHKAELATQRAAAASQDLETLRSEMTNKIENLGRRFTQQLREKDEVLAEAADHIERLESQLAQTQRHATEADLFSYAARRTAGHPRGADIMSLVESGRLTSKEEVKHLAEEWDAGAQEPGGASERIRRSLGRGRETPTETDQQQFTQLMEDRSPVPGLEEFDATMGELRHLAGINQDSFNGRSRF